MSANVTPIRSGRFASEAELHQAVSAYLTTLSVPHRNQPEVSQGAADIELQLPCGRPFALLELKNDLTRAALGDLSGYFEQCLKYRLASGLPVFLGPFFDPSMAVVDGLGRNAALGAFSALGGRADVGLLFIHAVRGSTTRSAGWFGFQLILRGTRVASYCAQQPEETLWPAGPLALVDLHSAGSRRDRVSA